MIAREYNKRIDVYETTTVQNEFGGNVVADALLFSSWAKVETNGVGYKATDFGINQFEDPVLFKCRYRNDFHYEGRTLYVIYRNEKYIIKGVRNVGVQNLEMEIYCQRLEKVNVEQPTT